MFTVQRATYARCALYSLSLVMRQTVKVLSLCEEWLMVCVGCISRLTKFGNYFTYDMVHCIAEICC